MVKRENHSFMVWYVAYNKTGMENEIFPDDVFIMSVCESWCPKYKTNQALKALDV